jgi:hypothetical protein
VKEDAEAKSLIRPTKKKRRENTEGIEVIMPAF